jgi:plasmid stabilization system protein ParE
LRLAILPKTRADLQGIAVYIAPDNPEAADRLLKAAGRTFQAIMRNPEIGSQTSFRKHGEFARERWRDLEITWSSTIIEGDEIVILRVLHGVRNLPRFFRRRFQ